ncbi:MAG: hypothetical protein GF344_20555 [Chitinivibrionales bacterium]|nr:hypothetical protein [Chitinivibrionales bacterium]
MTQNNKRIAVTHGRWAFLCAFLLQNKDRMKSMLLTAMDPEMVRAQIVLTGIAHGEPNLHSEVEYPDSTKDRAIVLSLNRPTPYMEASVLSYIKAIDMTNVLAGVANQLNVG